MKYIVDSSMTVYYGKVTVEADSFEEAEEKVKNGWAEGTLVEDRQEFHVDVVEPVPRVCCVCKATEEEENIIDVSDQPDMKDGDYCGKCLNNIKSGDKEDEHIG